MYWRILLFTFLSTTPTHGLNVQIDENKDEVSFHSPLVAELDPLAIERMAFDPMVQLHLNWTRPGRRKGPTRTLPRSLLDSRQDSPQCTPANYVLICPPAECCPPDFLVCCPSDYCCPEGYFCTGLQTCCVNGTVGCGESCCSSPLICGTIAGAQTCVDPGSTNVAAPTTAGTTIRASGGGAGTATGGADPSYTPAGQGQSKTNVAVIGGAVGGGIGALILISLLAWYLLRQKKVKGVSEPGGPKSMPKSYTNGQPPMVAAVTHNSNGVAGPGGYVSSPPEDVLSTASPGPGGGSYYGSGSTTYGGSATPPTSAYSPSRHETISAAGNTYEINANPPWVAGVGSPSEQQQQQYSQQQHALWSGGVSTASTHDPSLPPWTSGVSGLSHDQPLQQPQQPLQMYHAAPPQPWLDPRLAPSTSPMTPPPPPFSPGPIGLTPPLEGGSSGGGRVVPMKAPADRKAKPTKTVSGT